MILCAIWMYVVGYIQGYRECEETTRKVLNQLIEDYKIDVPE